MGVATTATSQQRDLALLLSLVTDPDEMATEMRPKDHQRLRAVDELADGDHRVWDDLGVDTADRARLAYRILVGSGQS